MFTKHCWSKPTPISVSQIGLIWKIAFGTKLGILIKFLKTAFTFQFNFPVSLCNAIVVLRSSTGLLVSAYGQFVLLFWCSDWLKWTIRSSTRTSDYSNFGIFTASCTEWMSPCVYFHFLKNKIEISQYFTELIFMFV